jgi:hypothetical protein
MKSDSNGEGKTHWSAFPFFLLPGFGPRRKDEIKVFLPRRAAEAEIPHLLSSFGSLSFSLTCLAEAISSPTSPSLFSISLLYDPISY